MPGRPPTIDAKLRQLTDAAAALRAGPAVAAALGRWRAEAAAAAFHLRDPDGGPLLLGVLGGTGTGKSTLVNRLAGAAVTAASFRRTFTAGAVAVAADPATLPPGWPGVPIEVAPPEAVPARGRADVLVVVPHAAPLLGRVTLIDTPDLDGDQPAHHAQADRLFRWAQAVLFLVSPEKYQMNELLPYYRLARRYAVPALFVMNKCETPEMLDDYRRLLRSQYNDAAPGGAPAAGADEPHVFAVPRDDAGFEPPAGANLSALRDALARLALPAAGERERGRLARVGDVVSRLRDRVLSPLRDARRAVDAAAAALAALETPPPGIDVNPLTQQLQRRLQQRSVLYLIGPGRVLDRLRQMPSLLVRLPRTTWDLLFKGQTPAGALAGLRGEADAGLPDFHAVLADQFRVVQSRIDDVVRGTAGAAGWADDPAYAASKIDPADAGKIADDELAQLKHWLESRWDATPRDTRLLMKMLKYLPGGERLTQWSEAAPYLLAVVVAAHHAFFGHIDLMILGGYSLATWLTERISNEVAGRTRAANRAVASRFTDLAHEQIRRTAEWLQSQAPPVTEIERVQRLADEVSEVTDEA